MKRFVFVSGLALLFAAAPAAAQVSVYGGGGAAFPSGDDLDGVDSGLQLVGGVVVDVSSMLSIYAEGQWGRHDVEDEGETGTANPSALMAGLLLGFSPANSPIEPYVFAGLGLQSVSLEADESPVSVDDRTFGWQLGAGIGFPLGSLNGFAEGRYQAASFDADSEFGELDFAIFSLIVGLSIDLGGS